MVGGLLNKNLTAEAEQEKINLCAEDGWELFQVLARKVRGEEYTVYYFRRTKTGGKTVPNPRFDMQLFKTS
jgi:predicted rRNA methylase YqxC with S4 and FtsJ domains